MFNTEYEFNLSGLYKCECLNIRVGQNETCYLLLVNGIITKFQERDY